MRTLCLLVASVVLAVIAAATDANGIDPAKPAKYDMSCLYESGVGATYDLQKLADMSQQQSVVAVDRMQIALDGTAFQYEYTFGVCTAVRAPKISRNLMETLLTAWTSAGHQCGRLICPRLSTTPPM